MSAPEAYTFVWISQEPSASLAGCSLSGEEWMMEGTICKGGLVDQAVRTRGWNVPRDLDDDEDDLFDDDDDLDDDEDDLFDDDDDLDDDEDDPFEDDEDDYDDEDFDASLDRQRKIVALGLTGLVDVSAVLEFSFEGTARALPDLLKDTKNLNLTRAWC